MVIIFLKALNQMCKIYRKENKNIEIVFSYVAEKIDSVQLFISLARVLHLIWIQ